MRKPLAAFNVRIRRLREAGELVTRILEKSLAGEGKALLDAIHVGRIHDDGAAHRAAAFRLFTLEEVAFAGAGAQHFAAGGDLKPLRDRFLCLNAFGASHNAELSLTKRARNISACHARRKRYFRLLWF